MQRLLDAPTSSSSCGPPARPAARPVDRDRLPLSRQAPLRRGLRGAPRSGPGTRLAVRASVASGPFHPLAYRAGIPPVPWCFAGRRARLLRRKGRRSRRRGCGHRRAAAAGHGRDGRRLGAGGGSGFPSFRALWLPSGRRGRPSTLPSCSSRLPSPSSSPSQGSHWPVRRFQERLPDHETTRTWQDAENAALLARELVNFRYRVGHERPENALDWREGPDDDLVLALAIAAWEAEKRPGLAYSFSYGEPVDRPFRGV
jgi:hypothetical protein